LNYKDIKKLIGKEIEVVIDRKLGSKHPKWGFIYPINYGYVQGIKAPDGDDLDAYVLDVFKPVEKFKGVCIAIIHREDDNDDKLVVVPKGKDLTDEAILALVKFQERFFKPTIIRK